MLAPRIVAATKADVAQNHRLSLKRLSFHSFQFLGIGPPSSTSLPGARTHPSLYRSSCLSMWARIRVRK
eukprot:12637696-Prorocentrum_lima.AAC.1